MSDEKKLDWLDETEQLLIGAWDILGKRGPKLVRELRIARKELDEHKAVLAQIGSMGAFDENGRCFNLATCAQERQHKCEHELALTFLQDEEKSMLCPRRAESPFKSFPENERDHWGGDGKCSYCGSISPATLFERIEKGTVRLSPTDKNYKLYVYNEGGAKFPMWHTRTCPDVMTCDRATCTHWTKDEQDMTKFYFQHLSREEQEKFVALFNEKKLKFTEPGGFYVMPFFMRKVA